MELETQKLIREGAEAANLMEPGPARDLIAHLTQALEAVYADSVTGQLEHARWQERAKELEAIVNDGGNQAAKYWTRLTAAERALEAERANVKRAQAEALREAAKWAEDLAVHDGLMYREYDDGEMEAASIPEALRYRANRIENEGERA